MGIRARIIQGIPGPIGEQGEIGPACTVEVGAVSTLTAGLPATVTNAGTPEAAIFDFGIPQGVQGDSGPAGVSFTWKGAYSGATAYVLNDVVLNSGSTWIALQSTTGNAPPTLPTTLNTYWELAAAKGDQGPAGAGTGDMLAATYDSGGLAVNVYARGNHTGTQPASTISDFSTAADARISAAIGASVQAYSAVLDATTSSFTTALSSKLSGIEALADVTDATNVDAAGAVMNSDSSTASMGFVIDEDSMASNLATKIPTQQSVKAYVDAKTYTFTDAFCGMILSPSNKDYMICVKVPFAGTITETVTKSVSGTCTATFKINTTAVGGSANAVSSTEVGTARTTSNAFSAGDDLVITISSNSSCADMSFTIKFTRGL